MSRADCAVCKTAHRFRVGIVHGDFFKGHLSRITHSAVQEYCRDAEGDTTWVVSPSAFSDLRRFPAPQIPKIFHCLSTWLRLSQPSSVTITRSSMRTPNSPGRYTPGSMENTMPAWMGAVLAALTSPCS